MEVNKLKQTMDDLKQALTDQILDLKPAPEPPADAVPFQDLYLDGTEKDDSRWRALLEEYLAKAETFEIHCWNEETEWIELALGYGTLKEADWRYGRIITGAVTPAFRELLLSLPKPVDTELCNKMTPYFQIFLDGDFQSCHYGTENYYR